jgi:hypothetical protein
MRKEQRTLKSNHFFSIFNLFKMQEKLIFNVKGVSFAMVFVKGGKFMMGSDQYSSEGPVHEVTIGDHYMMETDVTQELYEAVMGTNPSHFTGDKKRPVERVNYYDSVAFANKINELVAKETGCYFSLPSESMFEYAARGGNKSKGFTYAGSNDINEVAWYWGNSNSQTHPVATKAPNELGLYDMCGNVWDWCIDDWHSNYVGAPTDGTPWIDDEKEREEIMNQEFWKIYKRRMSNCVEPVQTDNCFGCSDDGNINFVFSASIPKSIFVPQLKWTQDGTVLVANSLGGQFRILKLVQDGKEVNILFDSKDSNKPLLTGTLENLKDFAQNRFCQEFSDQNA